MNNNSKYYYRILLFLIIVIFISQIFYNVYTKKISPYILKEPPIYYNIDNILGRGVFASRNIKSGEKIEISPTIEVENINGILKNYVFVSKNKHYIAFGCGSMFNHSDDANVDWAFNDRNDIVFVANKPIKKNEQMFINYGLFYWNKRNDKKKV